MVMLRLHRTTFSPRPYHVLKIQERGEDGASLVPVVKPETVREW